MKKVVICLALVLTISVSFAQHPAPLPNYSSEYYFKKSENKRVGSILLVVAGALTLGSSMVTMGIPGGNVGPDFPVIPVVISGGLLVGSGFMSKSASKNKQKAFEASATIGVQKVPGFIPVLASTQFTSALSFNINF